MVAWFAIFDSFSKNSGQKMETISTKMSSWLSYNSITQRIVSGHFQSIDSSFVELSRGESSTNVHGGHFVTIDSADFQASSGQFDGLSET